MNQEDFQIKWSEAETSRLGNRVQIDYRAALGDHNRRINRWREYYRRWRAMVDMPAAGEEEASNVPVPFVRWNILTKLAKELDALFGDDAEIVAVPVGPSDYRRDAKIGKFMSWRVFNYMKLIVPFCIFVTRKLIFGRAIAYSPWKRETFDVKGHEVVDYEAPDFQPLWPDDIVVPAEEVNTIHDFSFVIRKVRVTPDQLLKGEDEGRYQGITKHWDTIINQAQHGMQRESQGDEIKREKDAAEGISYTRPLSSGESLLMLEWYGRWRPLKKGKKDGAEMDFKSREMRQKEFVVRYLWDLNLVVGVQSLDDLYPTMKNKRPFVESSMIKDGSYWSPGMVELLVDLEDELRANHNQATEAAALAMNPPIGYRPASGFNPATFRMTPGLSIPLDNPATDLRQIEIKADMNMASWKEQCTLAYGEKLTGMSDLQMGRQSDRPNAPRTAQQTVSLLEEGNVRISLDTKILREDMALVLLHFWELEYLFGADEVFFRVTEEDAGDLFSTQDGGAKLTLDDRDGRYDFKLQFANSVYSREAKKQNTLARYQLDLQNPLIVQSPQALWEITREVHDALGDSNFESLVPRPAQADMPVDPKTEWVNILHGDEVNVNPQDNDLVHMTRHMKDIQMAEKDPAHVDPEKVRALVVHYHDHLNQLQQKKMMQAVMEQAVNAYSQLQNGQAGPASTVNMRNGLFNSPNTQPPGNPATQPPQIYSGHPEELHGA